VIAAVWQTASTETLVSAEMLHAFIHSGNYVVLALRHGEPVGAAIGFLGSGPDGTYLHSHIAGVAPGLQGGDIGYAMKLHQRAWCIERGIGSIVWTYDPLVRRNAYFNLVKLGAAAVSFHPNFYGVMSDGLNAGDESDRMLVRWDLTTFPPAPATAFDELAASAPSVLEIDAGQHPLRVGEPAGVFVCDIPADISFLRSSATTLALEWRLAFRETVGAALAAGQDVLGFSRARGYVVGPRATPAQATAWDGTMGA
jgi:predicted GNAT superfamily acetyltransferase